MQSNSGQARNAYQRHYSIYLPAQLDATQTPLVWLPLGLTKGHMVIAVDKTAPRIAYAVREGKPRSTQDVGTVW